MPTYSGNGKTCLFLPLESPSFLSRQSSRVSRTALTRVWAPRWGIPRFQVLDPFRMQAHQHFGAQGGNFGPRHCFRFTGPPTYDRYRQQCSCSFKKQGGWGPFPYPVTSSSVSAYMAINSRHSYSGQTHSRLSKRDRSSRLPISAEPANNKAPTRTSDPDLQDVGNSNTGHVCHSPQHASSPVYVFNSGASNTGDRCPITRLAGEVDVHVSTVPSA